MEPNRLTDRVSREPVTVERDFGVDLGLCRPAHGLGCSRLFNMPTIVHVGLEALVTDPGDLASAATKFERAVPPGELSR